MARKKKHVTEMTDQEVADHFINYGRTQEYAAVYEVFRVAARLITKLEQVDTAELDSMTTSAQAAAFLYKSQKEVFQALGMRELLAGTVKRYAFANPFGEDDFDPDGRRSVAVAELILQDAAATNRKMDEPDEDEE